jgi:N-acetylmuramoyl-L-alanine amidase
MNVFLCAGHCKSSPGCSNKKLGLIEYQETAKIVQLLDTALTAKNGTPPPSIIVVPSLPLAEKIKYINDIGTSADIAIDIHFNASYTKYARGVEVYHYPNSTQGFKLAQALLTSFEVSTPLAIRGNFPNSMFAFLRKTKPAAVLVELLYLDDELDSAYLQQPRAHAHLGGLIFKGIVAYLMQALKQGQLKEEIDFESSNFN